MEQNSRNHHFIEHLVLPAIDSVALWLAFLLSYWIRIKSGLIYYGSEAFLTPYILLFIFTMPVCLIIFYSLDLYDNNEIYYGTTEYIQVIKGVTFCVPVIIVISFWIGDFSPSRGWLLGFWILGISFMGIERFCIRRIIRPFFRSGKKSEPILIVGANEEACIIAQMLMETGRMTVVGFLDEFGSVGDEVFGGIIIKGSPREYDRVAAEEAVKKIIMVPEAVSWETSREILSGATKSNDLIIFLASGLSELFSANLQVSYVGYVPLLRFRPGYVGGLNKIAKNVLDMSLGVLMLLLTWPLMLVISGWILWREGRPILQAHQVLGVTGKPFFTYKFRTGRVTIESREFNPVTDAPSGNPGKLSITGILLTTGLDKLPQLFNIIKGQMSLVGPRTIYKENMQKYGIWLPSLLVVKPGMTGLWAIEDTSNLQQEISRTLSYIYTWTPWKDFQVLFLSIFMLWHRRLRARNL